jgi:hypothetical protein
MSRINNYTELVIERKRIERIIVEEKQILNEGLHDLKEKLEPFLYLLPVLNIFKKKTSNNSFLKFAASLGIDLFVGQRLLAKSSWLSRIIIPMVLKGVSALAIGGHTSKENSTKLIAEQETI